jgi:hypothetical protein
MMYCFSRADAERIDWGHEPLGCQPCASQQQDVNDVSQGTRCHIDPIHANGYYNAYDESSNSWSIGLVYV